MIIDNRYYRIKLIFGYRLRALPYIYIFYDDLTPWYAKYVQTHIFFILRPRWPIFTPVGRGSLCWQ